MPRSLLLGLILAVCGGCQMPTNGGSMGENSSSEAWNDLPVPKGFRPVSDPSAAAPVDAGTYRAGDLIFQGRGRVDDVLAYYEERMPLQGWTFDSSKQAWTKGPTAVSVYVNPLNKGASDDIATKLRLLLRVVSDRELVKG